MFYQRIQLLFKRPDFQKNPVNALLKRLILRLWWYITNRPYIIKFANNLKIGIPKTGSGALIYYQGFSEFDTTDFLLRFLRPGMVLVDVGAHIGEYTLLASQAVGASGQVHAFEPLPNLFPVMSENVRMNDLNNVILNCSAVSDRPGEVEFVIADNPAVSSIRKHATSETDSKKLVKVACTSLDNYWLNKNQKIDIIKVDVEGAEKLVFQGANSLLSLPASEAPTWIFEYAPANYAGFGYQPQEIIELLTKYGYQICEYCGSGKIGDFKLDIDPSIITNLIATKDTNYLLSLLNGTKIAVSIS